MTLVSQGIDLTAEALSWAPKGGRRTIDGISFSVAAGDRLVIVGPEGAGKSTLLKLLHRVIRPKTGEVRLGGEDIRTIKPNLFARQVALVSQHGPVSFPFSVRDVVLMGRIPWRRGLGHWTEEDREVTRSVIEHLGLVDLSLRQFPGLSADAKQRVLIARALAQRPKLLILDEPSSHVDKSHLLEIFGLLGGLGITVIATLHDLDLAAGFATRAGVMKAGRMIAFGAPEQVLTRRIITEAFVDGAVIEKPSDGARRSSLWH
ncbi:ABC transporter ATP-binding protein [Rhizobium sp.]